MTAIEKWKASNPLAKWRAKGECSIIMAAAQVGVSRQAWWSWENGQYEPDDFNWPFIERLTREPRIKRMYRAWKMRHPALKRSMGK